MVTVTPGVNRRPVTVTSVPPAVGQPAVALPLSVQPCTLYTAGGCM